MLNSSVSLYLESGSRLSKFYRDFLVQRHIYDNIFFKIRTVFPEAWVKLWKYALAHSAEKSFKNSFTRIKTTDDL